MIRSEVKVTKVWKLQKWLISKSISSTSMHIIKRLMVSYDTPRQYLNLSWIGFLIFFLVWHHVTFKLRVFDLRQTNFASCEESTGSPNMELIFIKCDEFCRRKIWTGFHECERYLCRIARATVNRTSWERCSVNCRRQTSLLLHCQVNSTNSVNRSATLDIARLTLWRQLLPYRYRYKTSCARPG